MAKKHWCFPYLRVDLAIVIRFKIHNKRTGWSIRWSCDYSKVDPDSGYINDLWKGIAAVTDFLGDFRLMLTNLHNLHVTQTIVLLQICPAELEGSSQADLPG